MTCRLAFFIQEWESKIRNFTLEESQMGFVFLPSKALDFFKEENCFPVVILFEDEPVGFFVLHNSGEIYDFTENVNSIFLRAFSIDRKNQGKGYAKLAMNSLPKFIQLYFPQVDEIVLTVNENNLAAKRLYEKSGFLYKGKNKLGRSGIELGMHYFLKGC
ncbi:GNAT family N-acetyltransferase [Cohnella luojiensis]|uniref:GNAT family N-acetyltransferase n=1 Tax=Cohnella luojiensis TaxID=652876 RepID=A0A4Y8LP79_9BACL|nr:GNAT family N-acetyltransferase [Cohnella luojiensis]TFE19495.1 GNAT family N-acetyltransferase [Cohnella luojiensis]